MDRAPAGKPRLLDRARTEIRRLEYSPRTEKSYVGWMKRFIVFHGKRHPVGMGRQEIVDFLTHLAVREKVSASTQNQALSAILFLYRRVLGMEMSWVDVYERPTAPERLPIELTPSEVRALLSRLERRTERLMAALMYGSGLRRIECCRLRVKDIDLERREIVVRGGKGRKDRNTILPTRLIRPLREHLGRLRHEYDEDVRRRHHLHEWVIQRAVRNARRAAGIAKPAGCHALRSRLRHPLDRKWP